MARAYSDDLREKVLAAYAAGKGTFRQLAERFEVSYGWVIKIHGAELRTGTRQRVPQRRRPSRIDSAQVRALIHQQPDIVLRELQQQLQQAGVSVSRTQLWRLLQKLGFRLKKSHSTPTSVTQNRTVRNAKSFSPRSAPSRRKT